MNLEDAFDAQSVVSKRRSVALTFRDPRYDDEATPPLSPSTTLTKPSSGFDFESDLEASRPYRRAQRDTVDFSFRSSVAHSNAWSLFSELSLSDVSLMSVIALPVYADEVGNSHHYAFGKRRPVPPLTPMMPLPATLVSNPEPLPSSFLRELVEITVQLSQFRGFADLFAQESRRKSTHPFFTLRKVFRTGKSFLLLSDLLGLRLDTCDMSPGSAGVSIDDIVIHQVIEALATALPLEPDEIFTADDALGSQSAPFLKVSSDSITWEPDCKHRTCQC